MLFMGIDPGKAGALAILDADGIPVEVLNTPMFLDENGKPDTYNIDAIRDYLERWRAAGKAVAGGLFVIVERLHAMPPKYAPGGIANYNRGVASGWAWMLTALRMPHTLVLPFVWQNEMLKGARGKDTKARSVDMARTLFPSVSLVPPGRRKPSDGIADALLMAEYGRRGGMRARPTAGQLPLEAGR